MTKSTEKEKTEKTAEANPSIEVAVIEQIPTKHQAAYSKRYYLINGLTLLIAIAAIALTLYNAQFNNTFAEQLTRKNTNLQKEVDALTEKQTTNQAQLDEKTNQFQQAQTSMQNKVDELNKQLQVAMNQRLYQNQDWLLLKARYYLELAQINAHWSDNFNAALSLLQEADKLLEQIHSPKILEVRQAIAKEILQLKAIPTVDISGLLSQLDALQTTIGTLTVESNLVEPKTAPPEQTTSPKQSTWQTGFQNSVSLLGKLVVIRRDDEQIKPLMSPLFESILRESVRLNLQEAQWAILNNNPQVYQLALKQASTNLKRAFQNTQNTNALLQQLNELQQIKITQEKPMAELALPLLNQIINSKELLINSEKNNDNKDNSQ